jgi:predicted transcriptional regulator
MSNKAVLMSIRPEWCDLIIRGQKTIEVRRTKPGNLKTPFRCYVYCTKSKSKIGWLLIVPGKGWQRLDGNIIGEFTCDGIRRIGPEYCVVKEDIESAIAGSCLTVPQVKDYAGWKGQKRLVDCRDAYCWHISNFKLYKKPVRLKDFWAIQPCTHRGDCCTCRRWDAEKLICRGEAFGIERPPQSWCYVEDGR